MPSRDYNSWRLQKLSDPERAAKYLKAALESSTEDFFYALKNVIQAHQVSEVAKKAGVKRESLYRVGNPTWDTLKSVLQALDLRFSGIEPILASPVAVPPIGSLGQRAKPRLQRGRKRRKGSTPLAQLRFNYEQTSTTPTPQRRSWATASMTTANIGVHLTLAENQRPVRTIALPPPTERVPVIYPGFYAAQSQHSQPAFPPIQQ